MMLIDSYDRVIIKPSYGLEGRGVELVETKEHDCSSLKEKLLSYGRNYVVQEVIRQHKSLAVYNNSSVNPIRIMTLRYCITEKASIMYRSMCLRGHTLLSL